MTTTNALETVGAVRDEKKSHPFFRGPLRTLVMGALGLLTLLALWELTTLILKVPDYLVPAPANVVQALIADRALLLSNAVPTIIEAALGFLLGNMIALVVATLFVYNRLIEEMFYPVAILIKTIPILAIAPVLKIILGNGIEPKVAIAALICFFPTLVNAVRGLRAVDSELLELMHVLSATKTQVFRRIRVYAALPYIFAALKISVTMCVLGAIVGEWIGANGGIGYLLLQSMFDFNTPRLFATILVASAIAITGFAFMSLAETRILRWAPAEKM
jgi:NitT/TauT family transport system permease protein